MWKILLVIEKYQILNSRFKKGFHTELTKNLKAHERKNVFSIKSEFKIGFSSFKKNFTQRSRRNAEIAEKKVN